MFRFVSYPTSSTRHRAHKLLRPTNNPRGPHVHTTFAPLCARVSQVRSPSPPVRVHLRGRHDCPTWAGLLEWAASAKLPEGSDPFELKHITLFVDLLQAKAALKQPDIKKVFRIKSLLAKCREHVLTALLNAYRLVLMEQLRVLKADGYTEARALSIGKGGARLHVLVEECCRAVAMPLCSHGARRPCRGTVRQSRILWQYTPRPQRPRGC